MSMEEPQSFYPMEASAREISLAAISRAGNRLRYLVGRENWAEIEELMAGAVHDGIEFGESIAVLPEQGTSKLEVYHQGYMDALEDTAIRKQGE